jgi:pimeloyl-ACP methyl ester carboxylesterase
MSMTLQHSPVKSWAQPEGLNPRGTVVLIPGRGEQPGVYERFGRRLAADAYRVHAVASPVGDPEATVEQIGGLLAEPGPFVLAGSDTGALFAAGLVASGRILADALVLAGLPAGPEAGADGALYEPVPDGWAEAAALKAVNVPVLGLHGAADPVSALAAAREKYAAAPQAELVSLAGGRHDAFNDITHRTAAATIVLFLERLRLAAGSAADAELAPIAVLEEL